MHRRWIGRCDADRNGIGDAMDSQIMDVLADRVLELGPEPEASGPYRHFRLTRDANGIAWLLFDRAEVSANTLSADVLAEFDSILSTLESERPAGLVLRP